MTCPRCQNTGRIPLDGRPAEETARYMTCSCGYGRSIACVDCGSPRPLGKSPRCYRCRAENVLQVQFTGDERAAVEAAADGSGMTVREWILTVARKQRTAA